MTKRAAESSKLTQALLATADDMCGAGVMDSATHEKIMLRHFGRAVSTVAEPLTGDEIRTLRENAHSQPGRLCLISQSDHGLCVATGA